MKIVSIENLLTWAFVDELPKVGSVGETAVAQSSWMVMQDVITLGTMIDKTPNAYGVVPGFIYGGEPHPDAVTVGDVVRGLARLDGFEIAAGWNPFPEWTDDHGLISAEVARVIAHEGCRSGRLNGKHIVNLVTSAAILKRGPDWAAEQPKIEMLTNGGKPAWFICRYRRDRKGNRVPYEDNGFDQKKQKPMAGAYRRYRLKRSIIGDIKERLDWQLWQDALMVLEQSLRGRLKAHDVLPFRPIRQPWLTQGKAGEVSQDVEKVP